jgi:hypothetical protein
MRRDRVGDDVGPVGVGAAIVLRTRLTLTVRFDQEPAEIGDRTVELIGLGTPPSGDRRIERIGCGQPVKNPRSGEVR